VNFQHLIAPTQARKRQGRIDTRGKKKVTASG
jgi:hypothetical protein